jgi:hypothetical protein
MIETAAARMRKHFTLLLISYLGLAAPFAQSAEGDPERTRVAVRDLRGRTVRPLVGKDRRATLLVFIAHDCPISNVYAREIGRICTAYRARGVATYVVYVERDLDHAKAEKHWREFGYPCAGLIDPDRKLIRLTGARMTPEAALLNRQGAVIYRGRIDDTYVDYGKRRHEPTSRDLRRAIEAHLAKKSISPSRTPVVGCYIPDA